MRIVLFVVSRLPAQRMRRLYGVGPLVVIASIYNAISNGTKCPGRSFACLVVPNGDGIKALSEEGAKGVVCHDTANDFRQHISDRINLDFGTQFLVLVLWKSIANKYKFEGAAFVDT